MATLYENHLASIAAKRAEPAYKAVLDAENDAFAKASNELDYTGAQIGRISSKFYANDTEMETYARGELLDALLTKARAQLRDVRRCMKAIHIRQRREENGVYRV